MAKKCVRFIHFLPPIGHSMSATVASMQRETPKTVVASKSKLFSTYQNLNVVNSGGIRSGKIDCDAAELKNNPLAGELITEQISTADS